MCTFTLYYNVTLTEPQTQCTWHQNNYEYIFRIVISQTKTLYTCCSLMFWQLRKLQSPHIKQYWCRKNIVRLSGLQVLWSLQRVQRDCLIVKVVCWITCAVCTKYSYFSPVGICLQYGLLYINVECNLGAIEWTCQCWVHFIVYHAFAQACTYHYIMICGRAWCGVVYALLKI